MPRAGQSELLLGLFVLAGLVTVPIVAGGTQGGGEQQPKKVFSGRSVFGTYCASCHGTSAKGNGPLADSLRKPPPDLTQFTKQNQGAFPAEKVRKIIDGREAVKGHGGPDMPVWGDAFSRSREDADPESVKRKIQAIVDYLESIQERPAGNN